MKPESLLHRHSRNVDKFRAVAIAHGDEYIERGRSHGPIAPATWGFVAGAAISTVGGFVAANQAKKANDGARGIAERLTYEPIDIDKVKADASAQAIANAKASLSLESQLQPDVAKARAGLSKSVSDQLAMGGNVPADIANRVAQQARVQGGASGGFGGTPGVTAATLGTTALNLLNQRQGAAAGLLATSPLPVAGLDPGALASLEVQQNSNMNEFNAAKAGVNTNLLQSNANQTAGTIGTAANSLASLASLYGSLGARSGGGVQSQVTSPYNYNGAPGVTMTPYVASASRIPGWN